MCFKCLVFGLWSRQVGPGISRKDLRKGCEQSSSGWLKKVRASVVQIWNDFFKVHVLLCQLKRGKTAKQHKSKFRSSVSACIFASWILQLFQLWMSRSFETTLTRKTTPSVVQMFLYYVSVFLTSGHSPPCEQYSLYIYQKRFLHK